MKLTDRLLDAFRETSAVLYFKARFLLLVYGVLIVSSIVITVYTAYINMNNPLQGYAINFRVVGPEIGLTLLLAGCTILLVRGHFALAAHSTLVALFITIWIAIIMDRTTILARLDTVVLAVGVLSATPLFIKRNKVVVLIYAGANLAALHAFMFFAGGSMGLPVRSIIEFLADTSMAFIFTGIISYNLFSINARALERMEEAILDLGRTNEELAATNEEMNATIEELEATNEEFEQQNRALGESYDVIKEALDEKNVLIKEVHHRVKNNMQIVSSLLKMQSDNVEEPAARQMLNDAVGRIYSMAGIHEKIYQTGNFSRVDMADYIRDLVAQVIKLVNRRPDDAGIVCTLEQIYLPVDQAVPCGILINEILTNAVKHGCGDGSPNCSVKISMSRSDGIITLAVSDSGPGIAKDVLAEGDKKKMGLNLINTLVRQLDAEMECTVDAGTRYTIRFPEKTGK